MERVTSATDCPCTDCGEPILKGNAALWVAGEGFYHQTCVPSSPSTPEVEEVVIGITAAGFEPCIVCGDQLYEAEPVGWVNHVDPSNNGLAHLRCCDLEPEEPEEPMADPDVTTYADLRNAILKAMPGLTEDDFRDHTVELAEDTFLTLSEATREDQEGVLLFVNDTDVPVAVESEHSPLFITKASQVEPFLTSHVIPRLHRAWAAHTAAIEHLERVLCLDDDSTSNTP
jgi:hypothetical protein